MKTPTRSAALALLLLAVGTLSTACGGSDDSNSPAGAAPGAFAGGLNPAQSATANPAGSTGITCSPGANLCVGNAVHQCNADGASTQLLTTCAAGQSCDSGTATCAASGQVNESPNLSNGIGATDSQNSENGQQANPQSEIPCFPNQTWCNGTVLNRCSRDGLSIAETQCPVCGDIGGVDGCIELSCQPSEVTCAGPALIGTCSADGLEQTTVPCPEGNVCEGAGTCVPVQCNTQALDSANGGESTVYWFGQGTTEIFGDISCGYGISQGNPNNGDGDSVNGIANGELFGAMNTDDYQDAASCGACVDMEYQDRTVNITIVDECPIGSNSTCTAGHIDLSRGAWNQLTGNAAGTQIFGVNWQFAPCDTSGNITLQLKEPDNQYFNEILVRDHRYQVARVEVQLTDNQTWVDAQRQRYNYWTPPDGNMGNYRVRVTDINGAVIEEQLLLQAGNQGGSSQFNCQ